MTEPGSKKAWADKPIELALSVFTQPEREKPAPSANSFGYACGVNAKPLVD